MLWVFLRYARDRDLDADLLSRLAWWVIVLGIIGSRLLFVLTHWSDFSGNPLSMFAVWRGGLQFSGAFLISIVVIVWFTRRHPEMPGLVVSDGIVFRAGARPGDRWARVHRGRRTPSDRDDLPAGVEVPGGRHP